MKKFMSIALAAMMMASMSGCSGNSGGSSSAQQGEEKVHVGVVQIMEHTSLDTSGSPSWTRWKRWDMAKTRLNTIFKTRRENRSNLSTICKKFVGDDVDLIVAIATPTAQTAAASTTDIPIVFSR